LVKPKLHLDTPLARAVCELFQRLEQRITFKKNVNVYLGGGMAVYLYTAERLTTDVDIEIAGKVSIPSDLTVDITSEDGIRNTVYFDTNFHTSLGLIQENYEEEAIPLDFGLKHLNLRVLAPCDLVLTKIDRFNERDKEDIASLVRHGLTTSDQIEQTGMSSLVDYVGGRDLVVMNLREAIAIAREVESSQRLDNLSSLSGSAGPSITFWQHAMEAIKANGIGSVNWAEVERKTIEESIGENGQSPSDVAEVICRYSPGAVSETRQEKVKVLIDHLAPRLQAYYSRNHGNPGCEPF
jgi:hypothetical protein